MIFMKNSQESGVDSLGSDRSWCPRERLPFRRGYGKSEGEACRLPPQDRRLSTTDPTLELQTPDSRLQTLSPLGRSHCARGRLAGFQVKAAPLNQDVEFDPQHADRIVGLGHVHGGKLDAGRIHDRDGTASDYLDHVVRSDERRGVLVEPQPDREGIVGEGGQQTAQPVALPEVLVNDDTIGETEAWRERDNAGPRERPLIAEGDHVLRQERRTRRGTSNRHPRGVEPPDGLRDWGAAQMGGKPKLIAPGEKDTGRMFQPLEQSVVISVAALLERQRFGLVSAQLIEDCLVSLSGIRGQ